MRRAHLFVLTRKREPQLVDVCFDGSTYCGLLHVRVKSHLDVVAQVVERDAVLGAVGEDKARRFVRVLEAQRELVGLAKAGAAEADDAERSHCRPRGFGKEVAR